MNTPKIDKLQLTAKDIISLIWMLIIFAATSYFGYQQQPVEMGIMVSLGGVGLFALHLDKFESFKGGGIEARLRGVVDEANATLSQVRELAQITAKISLADMGMGNFLSGMPVESQFRYRQELAGALAGLGVSEAKLYRIDALWLSAVQQMYFNAIEECVTERLSCDAFAENEKKEKIEDMRNVCEGIRASAAHSLPLKEWLVSYSFNEGDVAIMMSELLEYERSRKFPEGSRLFANDTNIFRDANLVEVFQDTLK